MYLMSGLIVFMNVIKELSWEWGPRKMKKISSIKRFQKEIRWRKARIMGRSSFPMSRLTQGGAILVPMEVPRIWCIYMSMNLKVLCLRMKSSIICTIWGGGQLVGSILPRYESRLLCLLCMECLCIGT